VGVFVASIIVTGMMDPVKYDNHQEQSQNEKKARAPRQMSTPPTRAAISDTSGYVNPGASHVPDIDKEKIIEIVAIAGMIINASVTEINPDTCIWKFGQLEDGIAFLLVKEVYGRKHEGAYWVSNGNAYAANGTAKTWSPSLPYSKVGIDYDTVVEAVKSFEKLM